MSETYKADKPHIVALGDVVNGFDFVGPFDSFELADVYCQGFVDPNWIICELAPPLED